MTARPSGLAPALPDLDREQVDWTHTAARSLEQVGLVCDIVPTKAGHPGWYLGEMLGYRAAPEQAAPLGADAGRLVETLDRAADVLDRIEAATGLAAEFGDYGALDRDLATIVLMQDGKPVGDLAVLAAPPRGQAATCREYLPLECTVARLALGEAEALAAGDMILAAAGPWPLAQAKAQFAGLTFDPSTGRLGTGIGAHSKMTGEGTMPEADRRRELQVPVTVRLSDTTIAADELARLGAGGTIDLGPVAEGLSVALAVGGRSIGTGELIRLGDRFAVLLDRAGEADRAMQEQDGDEA